MRPQPFPFVGDHRPDTDLIVQQTFEKLGVKAPPSRQTGGRTVPLNALDDEFAAVLIPHKSLGDRDRSVQYEQCSILDGVRRQYMNGDSLAIADAVMEPQ